ncbi:neutral amino acid transporter 9-like [Glandiceps talaboti]
MEDDERKPLLSVQIDYDEFGPNTPTSLTSPGYSSTPRGQYPENRLRSPSKSSLPRLSSADSHLGRSPSHGSFSDPNGQLSKASSTDERKTRKPFHYSPSTSSLSGVGQDQQASVTYNRHRYYSKLSPPQDDTLRIPDHIIPPTFFLLLPIRQTEQGKQSSIITIFSVWNTMMGTSLLSMPWAIGQAGFVLGIIILISMAGLTLYTCYRVVKSIDNVEHRGEVLEFSDVCKHYLGKWGEYCSVFFSLSALLGAMIVYWVLLSNFLYHSVKFIHDEVTHVNMSGSVNVTNGTICPSHTHASTHSLHQSLANLTSYTANTALSAVSKTNGTEESVFNKVWQQTLSVPFFLVIILGPLLNFKSPTFFTKFNALGTVCVTFILAFVTIKGVNWGINMDFQHVSYISYVPKASVCFPALTGTLALALFIHNCVLSIVRNQRNPENNGRDLSIAYFLVAMTYTWVGVIFYMSFPQRKSCIESNLLDNFPSNDILAFVARICLFLQMVTVFPLLIYIFRLQFMHTLFGAVYPGFLHVFLLNMCILALCVIFAIFLPQIGTIIRFSGAFCGLAYVFALPCLVHMLYLRQTKRLSWLSALVHSFIILLGVANFVGQFAIMNEEKH